MSGTGSHHKVLQAFSVSQSCLVSARFFLPPAELRHYFTTFYLLEWEVSGGGKVSDHLMPEWANLRFFEPSCAPDARTLGGMALSGATFSATGPTSQSIAFSIASGRSWGIGLLPLGWAKFVAADADELADCVVDGSTHPAFASFRSLGAGLFGAAPDAAAELERITQHFLARLGEAEPDGDRIVRVHQAMIDPETRSIADFAGMAGMSQRSLQRLCNRAFGFSPKQLLRRQRFMRSLAHFMLDPSLKWVGALDSQYHDQAQFVRDFHEFMGMTPSEYAAMDKPMLEAIMTERARIAGSPVQTMDSPNGPPMSG